MDYSFRFVPEITDKRINVLHVIDHLGLGGAQRVLQTLVREAPTHDIGVAVCSLRAAQNEVDLPVMIPRVTLARAKYDPRTVIDLVHMMRRYGFDLVHLHLPKAIISGLLAALVTDARALVHIHGRPDQKDGWYRIGLRLLRGRVDLAVPVSEASRRSLIASTGFNPQRTEVIYNMVDDRFNHTRWNRQQQRRALGIGQREVIVTYVGRLHPLKRVSDIIRASPMILRKCPHVQFLIVGEGPEREDLERLARQLSVDHAVRFLGYRSDVPGIARATDICILCSQYEALGLAALEMMAMKTPIVATRVDGLTEAVGENCGILIPPQDPPALAKAVIELASDEQRRQELGQQAYRRYRRLFHLDKQIERFRTAYRRLCEHSRSNPSSSVFPPPLDGSH